MTAARISPQAIQEVFRRLPDWTRADQARLEAARPGGSTFGRIMADAIARSAADQVMKDQADADVDGNPVAAWAFAVDAGNRAAGGA